ncbi:MAG: carbohydrate-binding domain-containing protein [Bacteroidales bacterium]|nr:carbohydrate-binding domain-containing protein [Bacteroidales bacterium]
MPSNNHRHTRRTLLQHAALTLCAAAVCVLTSCSEYDTHHEVGSDFAPYNSLVSDFTHPVFVQYHDGDVRVWGPYTDDVAIERHDGARLSLTALADSVALFVYGNAVGDTIQPLHGQLTVSSDRDFALYLNGLYLHSASGPAVQIHAPQATCYLVLPGSSINVLSDSLCSTDQTDREHACMWVDGLLYVDGAGTLTLSNRARPSDIATGDSLPSHALWTSGPLLCNYGITANVTSLYGYAIRTAGSDVQLVKGTWTLRAGADTLSVLYHLLADSLTVTQAHHDSLVTVRQSLASQYASSYSALTSLQTQVDSLTTAPSDSMTQALDSLTLLTDSLSAALAAAVTQLSADTVLIDTLTVQTDSLYLHRAISTDGGAITVGSSATLNIYNIGEEDEEDE